MSVSNKSKSNSKSIIPISHYHAASKRQRHVDEDDVANVSFDVEEDAIIAEVLNKKSSSPGKRTGFLNSVTILMENDEDDDDFGGIDFDELDENLILQHGLESVNLLMSEEHEDATNKKARDLLNDLSKDLSASSRGKRSAAQKMFNLFLTEIDMEFTLTTLPTSLFNLELLGKFADYMMKLTGAAQVCCQTCLDYLSAVKCWWQDEHRNHFSVEVGDNRYGKLRKNIKKAYIRRCIELNIPFAKTRESVTEDHLEYLLNVLFEEDSEQSIRDRCLLVFDWVAIGRISEVFGLVLNKDVLYKRSAHVGNANAMQITMLRTKTMTIESLLVYPHISKWILCPFHALACLLVTMNRPELRLFSGHGHDTESDVQHVNRILKSIYEAWMRSEKSGIPPDFSKYSSHAFRRGATNYGNEHPLMQTAWLLFQGGWSLDKVQTLFNYLTGSHKIASRAGLAMAGWQSLQGCGFSPGTIHTMNNVDKYEFICL
jgi:hypothetical protein